MASTNTWASGCTLRTKPAICTVIQIFFTLHGIENNWKNLAARQQSFLMYGLCSVNKYKGTELKFVPCYWKVKWYLFHIVEIYRMLRNFFYNTVFYNNFLYNIFFLKLFFIMDFFYNELFYNDFFYNDFFIMDFIMDFFYNGHFL